jgi:hypothetical protein
MRRYPHIGILISEVFSDEFIQNSKEELESDGLEIELQTYPVNQVYGSVEWAIPTFLVIYVLKSYFDGFLKEAGKDHYSVLKNWLKSKAEILKPIQVTTIVPDTSPNKIDVNNTQSKTFSIDSKTRDEIRIKFLFDNNLTIDDWNIAIDNALIMLEEHHLKEGNDCLTQQIEEKQLIGNQIFGIIDNETLQWVFLDFVKAHKRKIDSKK